jgi:hypothetical protein
MELEKQVVSLDLAKKLKELGVSQNAYWTWYTNGDNAHLMHNPEGYRGFENKSFDAFTVAELGEMLPQILKIKGITYQLFASVAMDKQWFVVYANEQDYEDNAPFPIKMTHNEADARAKMLIYLLENNLIKDSKK